MLSYEEIKKDPQIITNIKPFKTGKEYIFHQRKIIWKNLKKNNVTIALNVLYAKKQKIYPAYVSKYN